MIPHFLTKTDGASWTCAFAILLLNYNCALTSYILYFANADFFAETTETFSSVYATSSVVMGLILGQIWFGLVGDTLGRKKSFFWCTFLMFLGSFFSIFIGTIPIVSGFTKPLFEFVLFRFVLGVGAGGMYPIVATILRESLNEPDDANRMIAVVFGPVGSLGLVLAPVMVYVLTLMSTQEDWKWRSLLIIGTVPTAALLFMEVEERSQPHRQSSEDGNVESRRPFFVSVELLLSEIMYGLGTASIRPYLLGTSTAWFCSDLLYYGNLLYQVQFLDYLLSNSSSFDDDSLSFSIGAISLLGALAAILFWVGGLFSVVALHSLSALALQLHGFALCSAAFFTVSICKATLPSTWWPLTIFFYSITYFSIGFGPAPATFLIPSLLFPASVRSTANGLAAAAGKLGAMTGILIAGYVGFEVSNLMALFGGVGMLGIGATIFIIQTHIQAGSMVRRGGVDLTALNKGLSQVTFSGVGLFVDERVRTKPSLVGYGTSSVAENICSNFDGAVHSVYDDSDEESSLIKNRAC